MNLIVSIIYHNNSFVAGIGIVPDYFLYSIIGLTVLLCSSHKLSLFLIKNSFLGTILNKADCIFFVLQRIRVLWVCFQ